MLILFLACCAAVLRNPCCPIAKRSLRGSQLRRHAMRRRGNNSRQCLDVQMGCRTWTTLNKAKAAGNRHFGRPDEHWRAERTGGGHRLGGRSGRAQEIASRVQLLTDGQVRIRTGQCAPRFCKVAYDFLAHSVPDRSTRCDLAVRCVQRWCRRKNCRPFSAGMTTLLSPSSRKGVPGWRGLRRSVNRCRHPR